MAKQLKFEYKGSAYVLEYNRTAVRWMEARGLDLSHFEEKMATNACALLEGAFRMHHPSVVEDKVYEIVGFLGHRQELLQELVSMVSETYSALFSEEKDEPGNVKWTMA